MARRDSLKDTAKRIKQDVRRAVGEARARAEESGGRANNVNVARRANVVVAGNVGEDGASHRVTAHQTVTIRQNGEETFEETRTIESTS